MYICLWIIFGCSDQSLFLEGRLECEVLLFIFIIFFLGGGGGKAPLHSCFSLPSPPEIRGNLVFEIWTKRGVMKKLVRNRGLVERGYFKLFLQFSFKKACFHYCWTFRLVNIHTCYNQ